MKILIDTNIVIDILLKRENFFINSFSTIKKALAIGDTLYFPSSSVIDVYYIINKIKNDKNIALNAIEALIENFQFVETTDSNIRFARFSKIKDFEDAIVELAAENVNADIIITRNTKHFKDSKILAITPEEYLTNKKYC